MCASILLKVHRELFVPESAVSVFERLVWSEPPAGGQVLFDTACVLGGSIAGLLTARVLSDQVRQVVIVERDEVSTDGRSHPGVPHDQHAAAANAIEGEQWIVTLAGYGNARPGRTMDAFRACCAKLSAVFAEAASGAVTRDMATYRQADSRRRHFTGLRHFPARLVGGGDAVASFNPVYGQGLSCAALQASCLSSCLTGDPDLDSAATDFFDLQQLVVDAAWTVSAGGDAARLDAANNVEVPEGARRQRWAMEQVISATVVDASIARAFGDVRVMLRHPDVLADPALLERAVTANRMRQSPMLRPERTGVK